MSILAVDDELLILSELEDAIMEAQPNCTVSTFTRAADALTYAEQNHVETAFLDVEMPGMNGLELGGKLKEINPAINLIIVTGHAQYSLSAHKLRVSGFVVKPFTTDDIAAEIENLRVPAPSEPGQRVHVRCFGNFEVFVDGQMLHFPRSKAKEVFAYLVYKKGTSCTVKELAAALLADKDTGNLQMQIHINAMMKVFSDYDAKDVVVKEYNSLAVNPAKIDCDWYRYMSDDKMAARAYMGEFMYSYEWAEHMVGYLDRHMK